MKKINVITLGCSKNTVDSEHLMAQLAAAGYTVAADSDRTDARVVVVNTCGFIGDAKQESIDMILHAAAAKQAGRIDRLFVVGCLSERYADELRPELPEVDEFFGVKDWEGVVRALGGEWRSDLATERRLTTPRHYAYLKIGEGCDWKCGYCAIPLIRGPHVSVPMEQVLDEARRLAAGGVRELMVIAQDTTYYGVDLYGRRRLADLLTELCRIGGIEWIRLHYAYPTGFPDDVIEVMAHEPKICKYLDIPFQHISDAQLKAMKTPPHQRPTPYRLVERLRAAVPDIALRTTLLVGYPGETEADFAELLQFVDDVRFDRLGVFAYSEEEGTYSALHLKDDVPDEVKRRRVERIMERQKAISLDNNLRRVGRTERVVVDARQGDYYVYRTQYDSPEVDQELLTSRRRPTASARLFLRSTHHGRPRSTTSSGELTERTKTVVQRAFRSGRSVRPSCRPKKYLRPFFRFSVKNFYLWDVNVVTTIVHGGSGDHSEPRGAGAAADGGTRQVARTVRSDEDRGRRSAQGEQDVAGAGAFARSGAVVRAAGRRACRRRSESGTGAGACQPFSAGGRQVHCVVEPAAGITKP